MIQRSVQLFFLCFLSRVILLVWRLIISLLVFSWQYPNSLTEHGGGECEHGIYRKLWRREARRESMTEPIGRRPQRGWRHTHHLLKYRADRTVGLSLRSGWPSGVVQITTDKSCVIKWTVWITPKLLGFNAVLVAKKRRKRNWRDRVNTANQRSRHF